MTAAPSRRGRPPGNTGTALLDVAREVFLDHGYAGTTMDEVAARARISKSSLYREHASKADLFGAVVAHWAAAGRHAMRPSLDRLAVAADVRSGLLAWARTLLQGVLHPSVVEMRRLVTAEAARHPDVGTAYLEQSWASNIRDLADTLAALDARGVLRVPEPQVAAEQLTWLVVGAPLNARMLDGTSGAGDVAPAVGLFLAGHTPSSGQDPRSTGTPDDGARRARSTVET